MINDSTEYVLDANVFMEASRRYYPLDFAKPFWNSLVQYSSDGIICSIDKVFDEINKGNDALKTWANEEYKEYFISTRDSDILRNYSDIVNWAQGQSQFNQIAKDTFMEVSNADTWVLASALTHNLNIVTHEVFDANIKKRIPIPNVCREFDINHYDTFEMLRRLNFTF